ncbi:MAG: VacJ family lipoprotein [Rhodocyclaceae bacterium]|jgi:phospholipid-binding lipoprotein MlaA|nr:VacJ family lipoprotein [Rhodocyclaceae bacterium]
MKTGLSRQISKLAIVVAAAGLLGGCATSGNPKDPIEGFNRAMFGFNEGLDKVIIKPVATGYEAVLPSPLQTGVSNFFSNIADLMIGVNNLIQGKPAQAASDAGRVLVNTTMGFLGIIDVASTMGMEKHEEDFGQTFGRWGMGDGAYVVLPFFGPRTARDTIGLVFDVATDPVSHIDHIPSRNTLLAVRVISDRAQFLKADKVIEEAALDKYSYVRDAYLQRRQSLIHDGNPPKFDPYSGSQEGKVSEAPQEGTSAAQVATRN